MEYTIEEIQKKIDESILSHPELSVVAKRVRETTTLKELLLFVGIDPQYYTDVEFELLMVVALFVPLSQLPRNISESTGITLPESEKLANMIGVTLLDDVIESLRSYDLVLRSEADEETLETTTIETKERLELRPKVEEGAVHQTTNASEATTETPSTPDLVQPKPASKPLTREELMNALGGRRTMAQDIEAVRMKREADKNT